MFGVFRISLNLDDNEIYKITLFYFMKYCKKKQQNFKQFRGYSRIISGIAISDPLINLHTKATLV